MKWVPMCVLLFPVCLFARTVYLDELDTRYMLQDWGFPQTNKSVLGGPLRVAGVRYERGIGTHSISRLLIDLQGKALSFSGWAGADDLNDFGGNMEFELIADERLLWTSGILHKGMPAVPFCVGLQGVHQLALLVKEGGDGIMYDHADWLDARFLTDGEVVAEPCLPTTTVDAGKFILTPKPPASPRINGPKVLGVRPGNPVLFAIPATGERPMRFSAAHLPGGLTLDPVSGLITGTVGEAGTYNVVLTAANPLGSDVRILRIEAGDRICLTPPMGWNSWNCWGLKVDEQKVKDAAEFMGRDLIRHGWSYINIDDGWEATHRSADSTLNGNSRFPDFRNLCSSIHDRGLKFGIYSSPGPQTCGGHLGSYGHEDKDAATWADWGVDYLKYDYCYYSQIAPEPTEALIKHPYAVMRQALDKVKRDIVYCVGYGAPRVWYWGKEAGGNQWRTTRDITDDWNVVTAIGFFQDLCAPATEPGRYNDPDMLVVGRLGQGWGDKVHDSHLTADEQYTHVSLWCLQSAPLLIGCDLSHVDDFTMNLLTNDEVIAVDQDPLAMPVTKLIRPEGQVWYKWLEDGSIAVGLFNVNPYFILWDKAKGEAIQKKKTAMTLSFADLGLKGRFRVRDLWRQKDLGSF
ncbi:MAG: NPCBM/NEW2 domain-containing protein, partial [Bacteroidetes bacterium]|nr:NPCBM/NEW2 domain-containing protein [Bacteroidota bacterium]